VSNIELAQDKIRRWRKYPVLFVTDNFQVEPDPWQVDALTALGNPATRRIALPACKGPGKTAYLAWAILWFLTCLADKGNHPKGAATSITEDNINDNLWPEIAKWQGRSPFLMAAFEWRKERIAARDHPETWFFSKRTWPKAGDKSQQANTLAGLHADFLLFILDESGGIPDSVMAAAEGGLAVGKWGKIIQAGNPTHNEGPLYRACTVERHMWHVIRISGDPDDPNRSPRINVQWAKEQIEKYGRDNPWVLVNVFGEFPPSSINSLLGPDEVQAAMKRHLRIDQYEFSQKRLGIDVARFGDDRSVIFPRQGLASFKPEEMRGARTTDIAARVMKSINSFGAEMQFIDDTGHWGHGVIDNLIAAGYSPMGIQFHGQSLDPRYKNRRAEMWIEMAEWVKRGGALPNIPELVGELTTPTYTFVGGKFMIEDKDLIKQRLGRSPDLADALALTFAIPEMPTDHGLPTSFKQAGKFVSDYDPFENKEMAHAS
jgi:hypothetical protein